MRFYVSGKIGVEGNVRQVMKMLRDAGHKITFDWTVVRHFKPYDKNAEACRGAAIEESNAVRDADVLILLPHKRGIGMYVEFGMAIGFGIPVRVITNVESQTMFFHHPLVKKVSSTEEILEEFSIKGIEREYT